MQKIKFILPAMAFIFISSPSSAKDWNNAINCLGFIHKYSNYNAFDIANSASDNFKSNFKSELLKNDSDAKFQNKILVSSFENSIEKTIEAFGKKDIDYETYIKALKWNKIDKENIVTCANFIGADKNIANLFLKAVNKFLIENAAVNVEIFDKIIATKNNKESLEKFGPFIQLIKSNDELYSYLSTTEFKDIFEYPEFKLTMPTKENDVKKACLLPNHEVIPLGVYEVTTAYPVKAQEKEIQGAVSVVAWVDEDGNVNNAEIKSFSDPVFNADSVVKTALNTKFIPAQKDCAFISSKYTFNIIFKIR